MNNEIIKSIIYLLVGVSILLVGMKLMSSGLKKSIGKNIKKFFKKTQNNPAISMGIGTLVTAGIQSSDATNAMVVGFINAGAMQIHQGLYIMLGAYIGTTVTGILASFSSLSISMYFLLFSFIGTFMMFSKKEVVKNVGEILCGLGFLFFGLAVMKDAFKNPDIIAFCQNLFTSIKFGPLLFLIGVVITALIQSSSAVTSIVIAMVGGSALTLSSGLFLALGATLGTVATTVLTSLDGNIDGKRTAVTAFFLRSISSIVMLIFLSIFQDQIATFFHRFAIENSDELPIAIFTVFYNVLFMPLLIPLVKPSIKLISKAIKEKQDPSLQNVIHYIDNNLLVSPEIALMQVKKEITNMLDIAIKNFIYSMELLTKNDETNNKTLLENENSIDFLYKKITDFLILLSNKVQASSEKKVGTFFHVINDIERIGDHAVNFLNMHEEMSTNDLAFSDEGLNEIQRYYDELINMFTLTKDIFENKDYNKLGELSSLESTADSMKKEFMANHFNRIKLDSCSSLLSPYYSSLITELERIADHLYNIGNSIVNPTGNTAKQI